MTIYSIYYLWHLFYIFEYIQIQISNVIKSVVDFVVEFSSLAFCKKRRQLSHKLSEIRKQQK